MGVLLLAGCLLAPALATARDDLPAASGSTQSRTTDSRSAELTGAMQWLSPAWSPAQQAASVGKPDAVTPLHVPGSTRSYTRAQVANFSQAVDWWPADHPPMPRVVEHAVGKARPCALCHLPNGAGEPQSAPLAGLPAAYLTEQIAAFRTGARNNSAVMHVIAANLTDADVQAAAAYYAALPMPAGRIHVIETRRVPAMHTDYWMLLPTPASGSQALGNRLIETPADVPQTKLRNAHAGYVAFVPPGSIDRGKVLASGSGSSAACASCHGAGLRGSTIAPPLAGRSPTYVARQLALFSLGGRSGPASAPMQNVVAPLTLGDLISLAAYAATLKP